MFVEKKTNWQEDNRKQESCHYLIAIYNQRFITFEHCKF